MTDDTKNIFFIFLPVIICIIIFLYPSLKNLFTFNAQLPVFWKVFTTQFVHENFRHIFYNLLTYSIAMLLGYFLIKKNNRIIGKLIISFLILLPITTLFSLVLLGKIGFFTQNSVGFSAVSSASLGFLGYSIVRKFQCIDNMPRFNHIMLSSFILFLPCMAFFTYWMSGVLSLILVLIWVIVILALWIKARKNNFKKINMKWLQQIMIIISLSFLLWGMLLLAPAIPISSTNSRINSLAH